MAKAKAKAAPKRVAKKAKKASKPTVKKSAKKAQKVTKAAARKAAPKKVQKKATKSLSRESAFQKQTKVVKFSSANGKKAKLKAVPVLDVSDETQSSGSERRRVPRLNLTTEQFRLQKTGKIFPVADLSHDGIAIRVLDRADLLLFPVGTLVEGTLNLNREKYLVRARVRHIGTEMIGCQFEGLKPDVKKALVQVFDPVSLGKELRPIPASENSTVWYHAPTGTDLLFWRASDGGYRRFALFIMGSYAQWEEEGGLTTGRANHAFESSEIRGVMRFETMLLDPDRSPDAGKLNVAKKLIMSSKLPQELRKWCLSQLEIA